LSKSWEFIGDLKNILSGFHTVGYKSGIERKQRDTCGRKRLADPRADQHFLSVCFLLPGVRKFINFTLILRDLKG